MALDPISPLTTITDIDPVQQDVPIKSGWFLTSTIEGVPQDATSWMLQQGWEIIGMTTDKTVTPWVVKYTMRRTKSLNNNIVTDLAETFTDAYNEGRAANDIRYDDIVNLYCELLDKTQTQINAAETAYDGQLAVYISTIEAIESQYNLHLADVESISNEALAAVTSFLSQHAYHREYLGLNWADMMYGDAAAAELQAIGAVLTQFLSSYQTVLGYLDTEYGQHGAAAEALLENLGVTELARINEQFDAALSGQLQQLTDRGFYSSAITTDITTRVERERSEAITALNDKLALQKLENRHKLYEQILEVRLRDLDGHKTIEGISMEQQRWVYANRRALYEDVIKNRLAMMNALEIEEKVSEDNARWRVDNKRKLYGQLVEQQMQMANANLKLGEAKLQFTQYAIDERSKVVVGLTGFMERRTDSYPDMEALARLASGLGDAGTTQVAGA